MKLVKALFVAVTKYVVEEMNRSDDLEKKRRGTVGFALTIPQRRRCPAWQAIP
jgi:hypothetical protein